MPSDDVGTAVQPEMASASDVSPSPGSVLGRASLPDTPFEASASGSGAFLRLMLGHNDA
jgi:hypothetical protein